MKIVFDAEGILSYGLWRCPDCGKCFSSGGATIHTSECPTKGDYSSMEFLVGNKAIKTAKAKADVMKDENAKGLLPCSFADIKEALDPAVISAALASDP